MALNSNKQPPREEELPTVDEGYDPFSGAPPEASDLPVLDDGGFDPFGNQAPREFGNPYQEGQPLIVPGPGMDTEGPAGGFFGQFQRGFEAPDFRSARARAEERGFELSVDPETRREIF